MLKPDVSAGAQSPLDKLVVKRTEPLVIFRYAVRARPGNRILRSFAAAGNEAADAPISLCLTSLAGIHISKSPNNGV